MGRVRAPAHHMAQRLGYRRHSPGDRSRAWRAWSMHGLAVERCGLGTSGRSPSAGEGQVGARPHRPREAGVYRLPTSGPVTSRTGAAAESQTQVGARCSVAWVPGGDQQVVAEAARAGAGSAGTRQGRAAPRRTAPPPERGTMRGLRRAPGAGRARIRSNTRRRR